MVRLVVFLQRKREQTLDAIAFRISQRCNQITYVGPMDGEGVGGLLGLCVGDSVGMDVGPELNKAKKDTKKKQTNG